MITQCLIKGNQCERIEVNLNDCRKLEVYYQCKVNNLEISEINDKQVNLSFPSTEKSPNDIRIESSNISFIPSKIFEEFHDLKEFVAVNCSIKFIYQHTFLKAFKLHYLVLSHNRIQTIPDDAFRNISDLQSLKLDNNEIEVLLTNVFRGLNMLRTLKLSFNKIAYLPLYLLNDLESLEILQLDNNRIRIISLYQFVTNLWLTQIDFSNNQLTIIDNGTMDGLTNLQQLNFEKNVCVDATIKNIENISSILECCMTSPEEMTSCLATKHEVARKENGSTYIPMIVMLVVSILGNFMLFSFCFIKRELFKRNRRSDDTIELVNNFLSESSYQVF